MCILGMYGCWREEWRDAVAAVLSSAKIGTASWRYYTDSVACAVTEYYLGAGEAPGRWHGRGLGRLGLESGAVVAEAELEALFARALHPVTGQRLGRAWRADGVTGFDLTFSAPKSVSALWALGKPDVASAVRESHRAAVDAALDYLDLHIALSRRGTDGVEQIATEGLAVACFEHRTSRCADPQLHTHALVVNKVRCADGVWRSLDATELFHHKKSAGMIYQSALRNELTVRLGVTFEPVNEHGQAEIAGVSIGLLNLWSKRTAAIAADADPTIAEYEQLLGRSLTAAERAVVVKAAVLKTRPGKSRPQVCALQDAWVAEAERAGFAAGQVLDEVRAAARHHLARDVGPDALLVDAIAAASTARATFSRADVAGQIAARLPAHGLSAAETVARIEALTDRALALDEAVSVGRHPQGVTARASDERWAGADVLAAEAQVLSLAHQGRGGGYGQVPAEILTTSLIGSGLDESQHAAVRALAGAGDFLSVLTAPAGAGKTRTLGAATAAWEAAGYRVLGLAPSARAAAELAAATGGSADTLAKWLHNHDRIGILPGHEWARTVLDHRTVVVVDEASMAGTLDLAVLTGAAARKAAKVVLVGDPGQIGVVKGPGGMLAALANAGHGIELAGVHRFSEDWEREASLALRAGNPDVLARYQAEGRLHSCVDGAEAIEAVHGHWAALRADGVDALMMARTRADVDALNARARAAAQAAGDVHGPATRVGDRDWQTGDLLRTRRNDRRLPVGDSHVRNGDRYRVLTSDRAGLLVEDLGGRGRTLLPADYVAAHAEYGWASTIDAAQGATVDAGIVLVRPGLDREHLYVAMTRGRDANHAYIAPDPVTELDQHHLGPAHPSTRAALDPDEQARDLLVAALTKSGAQDAAHTARENARQRTAEEQRRAAERAERLRSAAPGVLAEHAATAALLTQRQQEARQLGHDQQRHRRQLHEARLELGRTPRWFRSRRRELETTIDDHDDALERSLPIHAQLSAEIEDLSSQVAQHKRDRQAQEGARTRRPRTEAARAVTELEPARPAVPANAHTPSADRRGDGHRRQDIDQQRAAERRRTFDYGPNPARGHDDGPSIGR